MFCRNGVLPIDREAVAPLYAETDTIARALGCEPPRLFYRPEAPAFLLGAKAAAWPSHNLVVLTDGALRLPHDQFRALLAHEIAHIAARHGRDWFPRVFQVAHRGAGLVAVGGALALGSPLLVVAAVAALVSAHCAVLHHVSRAEEEADAIAAWVVGSVAPLMDEADAPRSWRARAARFLACYPMRRPWLHRWAERARLLDGKR
jgi:Zn-dependent protease with chaperone function